MKIYLKLISMNLKSHMEYRLSFFLTIFGQFITAFTSFFCLYFVFQRVNAVGEFSYQQVLMCFAVIMTTFSIGEMVGGGLAVFPRMMGNGEFDRALVRPKGILMQVIVPNMDFTRIGLLVQAFLVLAYAVPRSGIIWSWDKILTLISMIVSGSIVFFALFLLRASFTFFTVQSLDFLNIFTYGARKFGEYPFVVYGKGVLKFLTFVIPLALFQYYPLLYLLDKEGSGLYMVLPLIASLFLIPCYAFFRFGLSKYKSTGS